MRQILSIVPDHFQGVRSPAVASKNWLTAVIVGDLLGFDSDFVIGYKGSKDQILGLLRGDFDVMGTSTSTALPYIQAGDLRPLLKIGQSTVDSHPAYRDVPRLGGPDGLAARRALILGRDPEEAQSLAEALAETIAAGRIVATPPGMEPGLASCLEERLFEAMTDAEFEAAMAKAGRPIDVVRGTAATELIRAAKLETASFAKIIQKHMEKEGGQ